MRNTETDFDKTPSSRQYPHVIGDYVPNLPLSEEARLKEVRAEFMGYATSTDRDIRNTQLAEEAAAVLVKHILDPGYSTTWEVNPIMAYTAIKDPVNARTEKPLNMNGVVTRLSVNIEPVIMRAIGKANHQWVMSQFVNPMTALLTADMPHEMSDPLLDSAEVALLSTISSLPFIAHYSFCQGLYGVKYSERDSEMLEAAVKFLKAAHALYVVHSKKIFICEKPINMELSSRGGIMDIKFWGCDYGKK